jgi:hypothetical protein
MKLIIITIIISLSNVVYSQSLPTNYSSYVNMLSNADDDGKMMLISKLLDIGHSHYYKKRHYGKVALTVSDTYSKIIATKKDIPIKNLICGTIHQTAASALQAAGFKETRVILVLNSNGSNHNVLIYHLNNKWIINNYKHTTVIYAKDIVNAVELNSMQDMSISPNGFSLIYDRNGEHLAYGKFSMGRLMADDPDKNAHENLKVKVAEDGLKLKLEETGGTDKIFGSYRTTTLGFNYGHIKPVDNYKLGMQASGNYSYINNIKNSKNTKHHLLDTNIALNISRNYKNIIIGLQIRQDVLLSWTFGTIKYSDDSLGKSKGAYADYNQTYNIFVNYSKKGWVFEGNTGLRLISDISIYKAIGGLLPEVIGNLSAGKDISYKSITVAAMASVGGVKAIYYILGSVTGEIMLIYKLSKSMKIIIGANKNYQIVRIKGFQQTHKEFINKVNLSIDTKYVSSGLLITKSDKILGFGVQIKAKF